MLYLVSDDPNFQMEPIVYSGPDADKILLLKLSELKDTFKEKLTQNKHMIITKNKRKNLNYVIHVISVRKKLLKQMKK